MGPNFREESLSCVVTFLPTVGIPTTVVIAVAAAARITTAVVMVGALGPVLVPNAVPTALPATAPPTRR